MTLLTTGRGTLSASLQGGAFRLSVLLRCFAHTRVCVLTHACACVRMCACANVRIACAWLSSSFSLRILTSNHASS